MMMTMTVSCDLPPPLTECTCTLPTRYPRAVQLIAVIFSQRSGASCGTSALLSWCFLLFRGSFASPVRALWPPDARRSVETDTIQTIYLPSIVIQVSLYRRARAFFRARTNAPARARERHRNDRERARDNGDFPVDFSSSFSRAVNRRRPTSMR